MRFDLNRKDSSVRLLPSGGGAAHGMTANPPILPLTKLRMQAWLTRKAIIHFISIIGTFVGALRRARAIDWSGTSSC
jgi:hypothetical protein